MSFRARSSSDYSMLQDSGQTYIRSFELFNVYYVYFSTDVGRMYMYVYGSADWLHFIFITLGGMLLFRVFWFAS